MLRISKKVEYALISMIYMAERAEGELTSARELSKQFNMPQEIIGKVLQNLARNGFVISVQGAKGGYRLAHRPESVRLAPVIAALDGPISVVGCLEGHDECGCDQLNFCNVRNPMEIIQARLVHLFDSITIRDLMTNSIRRPMDFSNSGGVRVSFIDPAN